MTPNRAMGVIVALIVLMGSQHIGKNTNGYVFAEDQPPPTPAQEQPEVLTRGPVHEAFAEPVTLQAQAGLTVPNQPPANIEEVPPADRPQGDQFVWVPGYWSWDADRDDFIWVSACWRVGPPDMYWVPGYWAQVADVQEVDRGGVDVRVGGISVHVGAGRESVRAARWEWVPGFWASASAQEIEYLPAPPAPLDMESPELPPGAEYMWVPGCWYWQGGQYVRRHGYWLRQQPDWVWEPSHYCWTPRGYVFVAGHWDYPLDRRGVLFAPVYLPRSVYGRAGFSYSPSIAIDVGVLSVNLFIYPRYSHYYFGDYFDDVYIGIGIFPRFECERRHTWYDPIYQHNRWHFRRTDPRWEEHERNEYDRRRANKELRPPRTYHEMETRLAGMPQSQRRNMQMAEPLRTFVTGKAAPLKFERIKNDAREKLSRHSTDVYTFREERSQWESSAGGRKTIPPSMERKDSVTQPDRVKIPDSPVVGKRSFWSAFKKGPPSRPADERKTEVKNNRRAK